MTNLRAYILATVTMVFGAGMGAGAVYYLFDKGAQHYLATAQTAEIGSAVSVLKRLRAGETNSAAELLEIQLDGALIGLGAMCHQTGVHKRNSMLQKTLARARDYRKQYPRSDENAEVGAAITNALNFADEKG